MNYDPIHDTFVSSTAKEDTVEIEEPESQNNGGSGEINEAGEAGSSPLRKAFSIENLVAPNNTISNIANTEDAETETDVENDKDQDFTVTDLQDIETDAASKERGHKKSGKSKKTSAAAAAAAAKGFRHLKKSDGEPFWRRDIQHDFLQELFNDETEAFTNYFPNCDIPAANNNPKITFSELYIRTLAESGKCSKILKERLLKDTEMGKSVGKVCLLVNAGRMNTTVNFVPEMRSTLRTYHSIPSLQADPVYGGSKPLQDTPRLKSILKAVAEVHGELKSLDDMLENPPSEKPNTNLVQLLFFLSNNVKGIKYHQDNSMEYNDNNNNFMEFFLNSRIHPKNRSKRFLWLVYTYLETSFIDSELAANPFNPSVIPPIELIAENEVDEFDKDTDFEIEYSEKMYSTRLRYLADEEHNNNPKRGNKSKKEKENGDQDESTFDESIESPLDQPPTPTSNKRPLPVDDAKSRKRKGKRNPAIHSSVVSSPLTKSVITYSADETNPDTSETDNVKNVDLDSNNVNPPVSSNGASNTIESNVLTSGIEEIPLPNGELISFPIEGLSEVIDLYSNAIDIPLRSENSVSMIARHNIVAKSKLIIRQVRNSSKPVGVEFTKKVDVLTDWLYKFFQYKKSSHNGLLGMEWEAIRYDLVHGLESFIYQQLGKFLNAQQDPQNPSTSNASGTNSVNGHEIDSIKEIGLNYLPIHDFNNFNEKNWFLVDLLSYCHEYFINQENKKFSDGFGKQRKKLITYDLHHEDIKYSYEI